MRSVVGRNPRADATLTSVAARVLRALVLVFTLVAVLDRFGVQTTSLVALIGATGLAIGLSLQGALANVAAGVLVYMQNGTVWSGAVQNVSKAERRRADLTFGIGYADDLGTAIQAIRAVLAEDARVLPDPEPVVVVEGLGDSSVDLLCRFWTAPADLFTTRWAITQAVTARFDAEGISIPFPQRDVHLIAQPSSDAG